MDLTKGATDEDFVDTPTAMVSGKSSYGGTSSDGTAETCGV